MQKTSVIKVGKKYGTVLVLKNVKPRKWLCVCDCGKKFEATDQRLRYFQYAKIEKGSCSCAKKNTCHFNDEGLRRLCEIQQPEQTFSLEEIGRAAGVSRERIRQIEAKALRKLRTLIKWHGVEKEFKAILKSKGVQKINNNL